MSPNGKGENIRRVGLVAKRASPDAMRTARELASWLERRGRQAFLDEATARDHHPENAPKREPFDPSQPYDLVIVLGGDGTLLALARSITEGVPILGVNLGNLGFLTESHRGELYPNLVQVLEGHFTIEERSLFEVELERAGGGTKSYRVLNDAVITKSALARIIELSIHVDGNLVTRYRSDGIIVSTPTGSTAYSLSAGGPILHPQLPVALLTPICPHALTLRPLVVPDTSCIEITLGTPSEEVYLTLDGQEGTSLAHQDKVRITRHPRGVGLIKTTGRSFYDSLRSKLRWGGLTEAATPPSPSDS